MCYPSVPTSVTSSPLLSGDYLSDFPWWFTESAAPPPSGWSPGKTLRAWVYFFILPAPVPKAGSVITLSDEEPTY